MTRQQMESHLALQGWFVVKAATPYLAHPDGRWVFRSGPPGAPYKTGTDSAGDLRLPLAGEFGLLDDFNFLLIVDAMTDRGWL